MKISLKWLSDYINISEYFANPQELANKLTAAGIEVEAIHNLAKQFEHVVVGHILEKGQHPNADRLSLCQVTTGEGRLHQIVCGAQNHKQDDNVVVALPGAVLPGDFAIKKSKIRGVESGGMLCSEVELGLKSESDGIMILPRDAKIGQPFAEYMGFDDIVFELKVTPNRADCLSHVGLAREIGTLLKRELTPQAQKFFHSDYFKQETSIKTSSATSSKSVALEVRNSELCPRYTGRVVKGVKVGPSPEWLRKRLESVGMNSINNVVDVTNFVMMELGQPLHAFDTSLIKGKKLIVDKAQAGEKFVALDKSELTLKGEELTIRDGERAVALAGVIGGENSGINDRTTEVFIESAYFVPSHVRKTSRSFGIDTDSSYRFSRGVNPEMAPIGRDRAAQLIQQIAGGEIAADTYDNYPKPFERGEIKITLQTLTDRLGYEVKAAEFEEWMKLLGCTVQSSGTNAWSIRPPLSRVDLSMDMDLVEEFARLHGYQHIPETLVASSAAPSTHTPEYLLHQKVRRVMAAEGFSQAVNYAFIANKYQTEFIGDAEKFKFFGLRSIAKSVPLVNPLNEELGVMRTALTPGLVRNVLHNVRFGVAAGQLFEVGFAHFKNDDAKETSSYGQEGRLALALWGSATGLWNKTASAPAVFRLKAHLEDVLTKLGFAKWTWTQTKSENVPQFLHPGQTATLTIEGKPVGFVGTLHPSLSQEWKVREDCALSELNLERLSSTLTRAPKFKPISKQPASDRDLAFVMPSDLAASAVEDVIRKTGGPLLKDVYVFDVFEGGQLQPGQRSVAYRLIFQDANATLEDSQVNALRDQIVGAISQKYGLSLR